MKHTVFFGTFLVLTLSAAGAQAQGMRAGVDFRVLPVGKVTFAAGDSSRSFDTAVALGFTGHIDYAINANLMIGLMPQFLFNVKGEDDSESATELDLMVRIAGGLPLGEIMAFGYIAPGYSLIFIPDSDETPKGLVIDFGFGGSYSISQQVYFSFDAGYQVGFQSVTLGNVSGEIKTSFLHLGAGIGARF
jgi:hypothetical protein